MNRGRVCWVSADSYIPKDPKKKKKTKQKDSRNDRPKSQLWKLVHAYVNHGYVAATTYVYYCLRVKRLESNDDV